MNDVGFCITAVPKMSFSVNFLYNSFCADYNHWVHLLLELLSRTGQGNNEDILAIWYTLAMAPAFWKSWGGFSYFLLFWHFLKTNSNFRQEQKWKIFVNANETNKQVHLGLMAH